MPMTIYMVKTSWLDACAKPVAATWTYDTAWRIANSIDSDHAAQLIVELLIVEPVWTEAGPYESD